MLHPILRWASLPEPLEKTDHAAPDILRIFYLPLAEPGNESSYFIPACPTLLKRNVCDQTAMKSHASIVEGIELSSIVLIPDAIGTMISSPSISRETTSSRGAQTDSRASGSIYTPDALQGIEAIKERSGMTGQGAVPVLGLRHGGYKVWQESIFN